MDLLLEVLGISSLGELISKMLGEFFLARANELWSLIDSYLGDLLTTAFHVETLSDFNGSPILSAAGIGDLYIFIYTVACALVGLKFLFKGFQIYILWRDGDADNSPKDMLMGAAQAAFVMMAFPTLYEYMADITIFLAQGVIAGIDGYDMVNTSFPTDGQQIAIDILMLIIVWLVYLIMIFILWLILIKRGFELLILRLGVPIACVGLIDSDGGVFKGYMQVFFKTMATTLIQICLMSLSIRVIASFNFINLIAGIAIVMTAFGTPTLMQSLLIHGGGGGGVTSKLHSAGVAARGVRMLIGK